MGTTRGNVKSSVGFLFRSFNFEVPLDPHALFSCQKGKQYDITSKWEADALEKHYKLWKMAKSSKLICTPLIIAITKPERAIASRYAYREARYVITLSNGGKPV